MNRLRVETSGNCAVCKHNRPDCKINEFFLIAAIFWCIKNAHKVVEKSALGVYKFRWLKTDLKAAHLLYPFCTPFRTLLNSFCTGLAAIFAAKACACSIFAAIKKATLAKKAKAAKRRKQKPQRLLHHLHLDAGLAGDALGDLLQVLAGHRLKVLARRGAVYAVNLYPPRTDLAVSLYQVRYLVLRGVVDDVRQVIPPH